MIKGIFIINNNGKPRLIKTYERMVRGTRGGACAGARRRRATTVVVDLHSARVPNDYLASPTPRATPPPPAERGAAADGRQGNLLAAVEAL